MTSTTDPTQRWTRELGQIRMQALKLRRKFASGPVDEVTDAALSACDSMMRDLSDSYLENQRLRGELRAESDAWEHLFEMMPAACLLTDHQGLILKANPAAGALLNVTPKRLKDRELLLFTDDRHGLADILNSLDPISPQVRATLTVRPKERRPIATSVVVTAATQDQHTAWLWFVIPCEEPSPMRRFPRDAKAKEGGDAPVETVVASSLGQPA